MGKKNSLALKVVLFSFVVYSCHGFLPATRSSPQIKVLIAPLFSSPASELSTSSLPRGKLSGNDGRSNPVNNIASAEDLIYEIEKNGQEKNTLLVVKYHAQFCKLCKRANLTYKQIASEWSEQLKEAEPKKHHIAVDDVRFLRLETSKIDKERTRELGITQFPFVQIYRGGECVASFATGPAQNFQRVVRESVNFFASMPEEDFAQFTDQFASEIAQKKVARENLAKWAKSIQ